MWITVAVLILTSLLVETIAQSGFCTREISGLPVVDMCQNGSWTLGRVFLSVNSNSLGDNSRCECTLRGRTTSQNTATTVTMWQLVNSPSGCINQHVVNVAWPSEPGVSGGSSNNITCFTPVNQAFTTATYTQPVSLTQLRSDVILSIGFCLFLQPDDYASDNLELTCQGTGTSTSESTVTTAPSSLTSSPAPLTSPGSSSESLPASSTSSSVAVMTSSASNDVTTPSDDTVTTGGTNSLSQTSEPFPTGAVAGGVVGGVVLIAIIVVIIVVCTRRKREPKPPSDGSSGAVNRGYENVLTDNILYESSSGLSNNQSRPSSQPMMSNGEGAYQSVDENGKGPSVSFYNTSGGQATVSTGNEKDRPIFGATDDYATVDEVTPRPGGAESKRTSAPPPAAPPPPAAAAAAPVPAPKPPSDQYAVVMKPPRQNKPAQNADARSQSTNVTLPSGDVYAVVDKARSRGSEPISPRSPPPDVAPPPAPDTTPGLVYADLDLVPSPRSSARTSAPPTDYAEIDHEASARL